MCRFTIGLVVGLVFVTCAHAQNALENPAPNSRHSGIGLVSGWKCTARTIIAIFDGTATLAVPYGSDRLDTQSACGDIDNGFGLLVNWNLLSNGSHTVQLFDDGVEFASATFTVQTLGSQFLEGLSKTTTVENFPHPGQTTTLQWSEAAQNFVITGLHGAATIPSPSCPGVHYEGNRSAVVDRVIDGDTMELRGGERVRYIGVDTPESDEPGFTAATTRNAELVAGKTVTLDICEADPLDPFGRTLAYVLVGATVVNEVLLEEGLADPLHIPPCGNETAACYQELAGEPPAPEECDPAYPTVCIPAPPPDLDCGDIPYRNFRVLPPDPHRFDADHDGIGCET